MFDKSLAKYKTDDTHRGQRLVWQRYKNDTHLAGDKLSVIFDNVRNDCFVYQNPI